jgi:hypothetical protein
VTLDNLGAAFVMWSCIALNLFTDESYKDVQSKPAKGLQYVWPAPNIKLPVIVTMATFSNPTWNRPHVTLIFFRPFD